MVTVEKVRGSRVLVRGVGRFSRGDRADVDEATAAYLCDERDDFERVTPTQSGVSAETLSTECGYQDASMDSPCARPAGWGTDSDTGRCRDHPSRPQSQSQPQS